MNYTSKLLLLLYKLNVNLNDYNLLLIKAKTSKANNKKMFIIIYSEYIVHFEDFGICELFFPFLSLNFKSINYV